MVIFTYMPSFITNKYTVHDITSYVLRKRTQVIQNELFLKTTRNDIK